MLLRKSGDGTLTRRNMSRVGQVEEKPGWVLVGPVTLIYLFRQH